MENKSSGLQQACEAPGRERAAGRGHASPQAGYDKEKPDAQA
jgi:hypothetical protein